MRPGRDLLTLEEEGGLVGNQVARKVLSGIDEAGDGRSPQIGALEKIEVGGGAAPLSFDLNRALDHGENFTWFLPAWTVETLDGSERLLGAAATDEPPRGLGGKEHKDDQRGPEAQISDEKEKKNQKKEDK